ncbi:TetR/AcrR family transcriptional regulator [Kiloniella antarctica]|uniref:TetR/AcrR family transcriptional regulator n=1 Tax=Kiloniella antarctica TaxID=1550907 RepID=A0ABW5BJU2_9PROT
MSDGKPTRDYIIEAADQLFYQQGYEHTSFADIAAAVRISRGNFYYHFKTKDDILDAVIELRLANTQDMLEQWEITGQSPQDRIKHFINILITNQTKIMRYGCPVGTLSTELAKMDHSAKTDASKLFTLFRTWLAQQFVFLGHATDADNLAMHLLARSQGVATLANAFRDKEFIAQEVTQMNEWLNKYCPS